MVPPISQVLADPKSFYVDTNYRILHEDDDILVVDKPAPLATHPVGAYKELNLHTLLQNEPARSAAMAIKMVHRLDAETSGILVAAKTDRAARHLGFQFMRGAVRKEYEAIVFGCPDETEGWIDYALGYDSSTRFRLIRRRDDAGGETARTFYQTLGFSGGYARLRLMPATGRAHQLRIHLALIGHPIVGDKIYVDSELFERYRTGGLDEVILTRLKLPRLALHATRIRFEHPASGIEVAFESELPEMLAGFWAQCATDGGETLKRRMYRDERLV